MDRARVACGHAIAPIAQYLEETYGITTLDDTVIIIVRCEDDHAA